MKAWAQSKHWDTALPFRSPVRILLKRLMVSASLGLIVFALSGPQIGTRLIEVKREGTDIVIVFDVSESMNASDITPSRIVKARHEIGRLLKKLKGDRVALVPFASVAFIQVPLTLDYSSVLTTLEAMDPGMIPYPGTSLGEAIKMGSQAFKSESKAQKIMLLITDSEDHETDPLQEAETASKAGIKIFTVGMATPAGAPIPIRDNRGNITGYKQYKKNTVVSRLDEVLLKEIAEKSGGAYFRATKSGTEFKKIFERISGMNTEEFETMQYSDYEDRFQWPLILALFILFLEMLIPFGKIRRES